MKTRKLHTLLNLLATSVFVFAFTFSAYANEQNGNSEKPPVEEQEEPSIILGIICTLSPELCIDDD